MYKAYRAQLIVMSVITCLTIQQTFAHEFDTPNGPHANPVGTVSNHEGASTSNSGSELSKSSTSTSTSTYTSETSSSSDEVGSINLKPAKKSAVNTAKANLAKKTKIKSTKKVKTASTKSGLKKKVTAANSAKAKKARIASKTTKKTIKTVSTSQSSKMAAAGAAGAGLGLAAGMAANDSAKNAATSANAMNSEMNKSSTSTIVNEHNITNTVNTTNTTNTMNSKSSSDKTMNGLEPLKNSDDELQAELDSLDVIALDKNSSSTSTVSSTQNSSNMKADDLKIDAKDSSEVVPEIAYLVPKKNELLASIGAGGLKTNLTSSDSISETKAESTRFNSVNSIAYGFSQGTYIGATMTYLNDQGTVDRTGFAQTTANASGFGDAQLFVGHKFMIGNNMAIIANGTALLSAENYKHTTNANGNTDDNAMSGRMSIRPEAIAYLYNDSLLGGGSLAYTFKQDGKMTNKNAAGVSSEISLAGGNLFEISGFVEQRAKLAIGGVLTYQYQEERNESSGIFKTTIAKQDLIMGTGYLKYQMIKELQLIGGLSYGRYLNLGGLSISDSNLFGASLSGKLIF